MLPGDFVELLEQLHGAERHMIDADGRPFLEADLDEHRLVGRFERILGHDEDVLGRFLRRIFENAALVRAVPQVAVARVRLLGGRLHGNALRVHVGDQVFATLELPLAPGGDHLEIRGERGVGQLEADLIVALAGAAVRERLRADALRQGDLPRRGEGPRHRSAEQIGAGVDGSRSERRKNKVADELFAQVLDHAVFRAGAFGFFRQPLQLAAALPDVGGEAQNPGAVGFAQPGHDGGGVQSAGVREDDKRAVAGFSLFMHTYE